MKQIIRIWPHINKKRKRQLYLILIFTIVSSILEVFSVGSIIPLISSLSEPHESKYLEYLGRFHYFRGLDLDAKVVILFSVFVSLILISSLLRFALVFAQTRLSYMIGADISVKLYSKILNQNFDFHQKNNSGDLISAISTKSNQVVGKAILPVILLGSSIVILTVISLALSFFAPFETFVVSLVIIGFYGYIAIVARPLLHRYGNTISIETSMLVRKIQSGLGSIRDIIIDQLQDKFTKDFSESDYRLRMAQSSALIISSSPRYLLESMGVLIIVVVLYLKGGSPDDFASNLPYVGAIAVAGMRILPLVQQIFSSWSFIKSGTHIVEDVLRLLELHDDVPSYYEAAFSFSHSLELKNISFRYDSGERTLKDVNLIIRKGQKVGLVGKTGSGKSTLLDLIMGLLAPTSGEILIDGVSINGKNKNFWRKGIAHVPQNIYLLPESIRDNITLVRKGEDINESRLSWACDVSQCREFVNPLKYGLDTVVGERGVNFSGGQIQRIGLARAFYKQSFLIILDEATSALDVGTEQKVIERIVNLDRSQTIIMVAHRLESLKFCDVIYEVDAGTINKSLSYAELISGSDN